LEGVSRRRIQQLCPLIATEGDEMQTTLVLETLGFYCHAGYCIPTLSLPKLGATRVGQPQFQMRKDWASPLKKFDGRQ
ncbi:MAG TPA: hypothetical protein VEG68_12430, partial [Terriglobales bacterium]|nr:hypothetical protein [Terriglobales bacterium]